MHAAVQDWLDELQESDPDSVLLIRVAIEQLAAEGPTANRPLVDHIKGSQFHNMKELRPGSTGRSEVRILLRSTRTARRSSWSQGIRAENGRVGIGKLSGWRISVSRSIWSR